MNLAEIALCLMLAGAPKPSTDEPKTSADQKRENRRAETAGKEGAKTDGGIALTPMDQSDTDRDVKLTKDIRQAVVDDERLSFTSKNAKIITRAGEVTLRGEVPSRAERDVLVDIARKYAGVKKVHDELEFPQSDKPANTN